MVFGVLFVEKRFHCLRDFVRYLRPAFVVQLQEQHKPLKSLYVYSPTIPVILNGKRGPRFQPA